MTDDTNSKILITGALLLLFIAWLIAATVEKGF